MKSKISVTLSQPTVQAMERHMQGFASRSEFVQAAVQRYLDDLEKLAADARDTEIINRNADRLNREAEDALSYQADL